MDWIVFFWSSFDTVSRGQTTGVLSAALGHRCVLTLGQRWKWTEICQEDPVSVTVMCTCTCCLSFC